MTLLVRSYLRRKKWESEMLAGTVWKVLNDAIQKDGSGPAAKGQRVAPDELLARMGVTL